MAAPNKAPLTPSKDSTGYSLPPAQDFYNLAIEYGTLVSRYLSLGEVRSSRPHIVNRSNPLGLPPVLFPDDT